MNTQPNPSQEWLEPDGWGGFASGSATGQRTRRYHALLLVATTPPTGRMVLVNGFDAWVETPAGRFALSSQAYSPGVVSPDGAERIENFTNDLWPSWRYRLEDGTELVQEIVVSPGKPGVAINWRLAGAKAGVKLFARPFLSGRDYHALHKENSTFRFEANREGERVTWHPYEDVPGVCSFANADYKHEPEWYRNFLYEEEKARGLDHTEDLASPGIFCWDLSQTDAAWILTADEALEADDKRVLPVLPRLLNWHANEQLRRRAFPSPLDRPADCYIVRRATSKSSAQKPSGKTILAGYPWFTDWGRDTFIALRGLCLATRRLGDAREILLSWASAVSEGMLPNRFADHGEKPEYNSVDASLWYVVAVHDFLAVARASGVTVSAAERSEFENAVLAILQGYERGTRYRIHQDKDGLLAAGEPGVQLTWMDAKVGDWVVTPRIGKPVEIQALWLNAVKIGGGLDAKWKAVFETGRDSFRSKFWNETLGGLHDVIDADHEPGRTDSTLRPNQIFAVGGLPFQLLEGEQARRVVDLVENRLWTRMGLRTMASEQPGYAAHYVGGVRERDGSYHQGTVWPWLIGPFVEAWIRVHGPTKANLQTAREKFLQPLLDHLKEAGLGHISEIADADPPHTPRGCPFQAWSVGEILRLDRQVLAIKPKDAPAPAKPKSNEPEVFKWE